MNAKMEEARQRLLDLPLWTPPVPRHRDMPELDDVLAITGQWAIDNIDTIREIYWQKGGWEGWAQVGLALRLVQQYPKTNTFREQTVYVGSTKRADLTLQLAGESTQVVELKMESLWQDASAGGAANFVTAVKNDMYKIDVNNVRPQYRPAIVYAIGLTLRDEVNQYAIDPNSWIPYVLGKDVNYKVLQLSTPEHPALLLWYASLIRPVDASSDQHTAGFPLGGAEPLSASRKEAEIEIV